ncbi:MAG: hypothetical protein AAF628_26785 [Planctomycetota bacterium]
MFVLELLPAREGDCLILTYGVSNSPKRVLIDGGRAATYDDLKRHTADAGTAFDLLIVTHVDRDHIEGVLELVEDGDDAMTFGEVWFNGYHHLGDEDFETFGAVQGERLTESLIKLHRAGATRWNGSFGPDFQKAAALPADDSLVEIPDGELQWTLLSPTRTKLQAMESKWERECEKAGIIAGKDGSDPDEEGFESFGAIDIEELAEEPFEEDGSPANGTSIALLAEHGGQRVLLAGDAHPSLLLGSLRRFGGGDPVALDAFKVPHHGSRKNVSKELLAMIDCQRYVFSTNGSYFDHPDPVAVSRIIRYGGDDVQLWFNYRSPETLVWDNARWQRDYGYSVHYPDADSNGFQRLSLAE